MQRCIAMDFAEQRASALRIKLKSVLGGGGGGAIHEISLHTGGVRNQGTIFSRKGARDEGGESQKLTCASTALDSKSEKAIGSHF